MELIHRQIREIQDSSYLNRYQAAARISELRILLKCMEKDNDKEFARMQKEVY